MGAALYCNGDYLRQRGDKWRSTVEGVARQFGSSIAESNWSMSQASSYPEYAMLADRPCKVLSVLGMHFPDDRKGCIRLDQGKPGISDDIPTITPKAVLWLPHLARMIDGWECANYQSVWLNPKWGLMDKYSASFVQDLMGNAFSATDCLHAVIVALAGVALAEQLSAEQVSVAPARRGTSFIFESFDPNESGSDID